jgi:acyl carrier protein
MTDDTNMQQIRDRFYALMDDLFGFERGELENAQTLSELAGWDSLNQVRLIAGLEEEFGLSFDQDDLASFDTFEHLFKHIAEMQK